MVWSLEKAECKCDDNGEVMEGQERNSDAEAESKIGAEARARRHGRKPGMNGDGVRWSLSTTHDVRNGLKVFQRSRVKLSSW